MEKTYVIYLNKSYGTWMMDASRWAEINNIRPTEITEIISETCMWVYIEKGLLNGATLYFVKDIITNHQ
jgi:hypothetical protein